MGNILGDIYRKHIVPIIYIYKKEVEQYISKGNVILIKNGVPSHITKAMKILYNRNNV